MTTDLQTRIAAIKAECEEILRLEPEIAGPGKWEAQRDDTGRPCVMCGEYCVAEMLMMAPGNGKDCTRTDNATFIAHSRNVSPKMARVVLMAIRYAEDQDLNTEDTILLLSIADQWEGK